ncbi:putative protein disulfide-isomerase [Smittium mucronatum]|uniref:Thioredoxin domain-containing protein n=1 Tax=Smittium mucronatum TaxID=133383 RepID=A0A1R0H3G7_9FUNG|nr:putative protein disulfide-isomerase [Smittium mucronatum]
MFFSIVRVASKAISVALCFAILFTTVSSESLYQYSKNVKELNSSNFDKIVNKSKHPVIVQFYAPWCPHCKSLYPEFLKAATKTRAYAKFYAVNCDEENSKALCGQMGIQGFPTIKGFFAEKNSSSISSPPTPKKKPVDFNMERKAPQLVYFAESRLKHSAAVIKPSSPAELISQLNDAFPATTIPESAPKNTAVLFTSKPKVPIMWKGISNGVAGKLNLAVVSSKYTAVTDALHIESFPSIVVFLAGPDGTFSLDRTVTFTDKFAYDQIVPFLRSHFKTVSSTPTSSPSQSASPLAKSDSVRSKDEL